MENFEKQILEFLKNVENSSVFRIEKKFKCSLLNLEVLERRGMIKINILNSSNSHIKARTVEITEKGRKAIEKIN